MKKRDDKNIQILSNNKITYNNCTFNYNNNFNIGKIILKIILIIVAALIVLHLDPQTRSFFILLFYKIVKD